MKDNLIGNLHIGRVTNSNNEDYIRIELEDEKSGTIVVRASLGLAEFTKALTSSNVRCKFDFFGDLVGLNREVKDEVVFIPSPTYTPKQELKEVIKKAVEPYEIDGWRVNYLDDGHNHHNITTYTSEGYYVRMIFIRFVNNE